MDRSEHRLFRESLSDGVQNDRTLALGLDDPAVEARVAGLDAAIGRLAEVDPAGQAVALGPGGAVDRVAPDVEQVLPPPEDAGHHGPDVHPDSQVPLRVQVPGGGDHRPAAGDAVAD